MKKSIAIIMRINAIIANRKKRWRKWTIKHGDSSGWPRTYAEHQYWQYLWDKIQISIDKLNQIKQNLLIHK